MQNTPHIPYFGQHWLSALMTYQFLSSGAAPYSWWAGSPFARGNYCRLILMVWLVFMRYTRRNFIMIDHWEWAVRGLLHHVMKCNSTNVVSFGMADETIDIISSGDGLRQARASPPQPIWHPRLDSTISSPWNQLLENILSFIDQMWTSSIIRDVDVKFCKLGVAIENHPNLWMCFNVQYICMLKTVYSYSISAPNHLSDQQ